MPSLPSGGLGLRGIAETAVAEFVGGRVVQVAANLTGGAAWHANLLNPLDIALDVLPGVAAATWRTVRAGRAAARAAEAAGEAGQALVRTGGDAAEETRRLLPAGEPASLAGQPGRLLPNPEWRQRRWQALREQYGIPESARMQSIYDVEPWEGPENLRVWLGTKGASGGFTPGGAEVPFQGGYRWGAEGEYAGMWMRGGVAGEYYLLAQAKGYPLPGEILGGQIGEDVWRPLSKAYMQEKGLPVPGRIELEQGLPLMIDYIAEHNGEIMFVLHEGISYEATRFTWIELQHILSNPTALSRTSFIIDWYY